MVYHDYRKNVYRYNLDCMIQKLEVNDQPQNRLKNLNRLVMVLDTNIGYHLDEEMYTNHIEELILVEID